MRPLKVYHTEICCSLACVSSINRDRQEHCALRSIMDK